MSSTTVERINTDVAIPLVQRYWPQVKQMRLTKVVSDRISMLRPLLIIGVMFVHVAGIPDTPSDLAPGLFNWVAAFFKNGVFRGTVPTMSLISGYLLFSTGLDRHPEKLLKKKFLTLAVPFVIFNLYYVYFMVVMHSAFGAVFPGWAILQSSPEQIFLAVFGINGYPINAPLHFIRDMMVTMMLVPLLGAFLRHCPWIGLIALAIFFGTDMDGLLIFRASSLILFYIGGAAAIYKWNVLALDRHAKECLAIFVVACAAVIGFRIDNNAFLVTVAPFLIWPAAALLQQTRIERWAHGLCQYSFFLFVAHMPILDAAWWGVAHYARWVPYPVFWCAAPVLTALFLKVFYDAAVKIMPDAFNFIIGARAFKPVFVDRRQAVRPPDAPVYSPETRLALLHS